MAEVSVSYIIVNFRTADLVLRCIDSIREHTRQQPYEIIIVDNASGDDSEAKLAHIPDVIFIANGANAGFGAANNRGAELACGRYLFFLNPDAYLLNDAAAVFTAFMDDSKNAGVGCCGGDLFDGEGGTQVAYGHFPSLTGIFFELGLHRFFPHKFEASFSIGVKNGDDRVKVVDYIAGADMFVRKAVFDQLKGFDADFFLYFEETEFAYRLRKSGYQSVLLPLARILHLEGASHQGGAHMSLGKAAYFESSRQKFFRKTKGVVTAMLVKLLLASQALIRACLHRDGYYLKLFRILVTS